MEQYLRLRVIGTFLTLVYMIMVYASFGKTFRDAIIVTAIMVLIISALMEVKNKKKNK